MDSATKGQAAHQREKAAEYEALADALEDLLAEVETADSIGETRLSTLFHEARTNSAEGTAYVTTFIDVEDGVAVVRDVKLRDGQWSAEMRSQYDALLSVLVEPLMDSSEFTETLRYNVQYLIRGARNNATECRQRADDLEATTEV